MSDEHWRAQDTPEATRARETDRIRDAARQRGEPMTGRQARDAADRVIQGRAEFDRHLLDLAEARARDRAEAGRDRGHTAGAGQMAAGHGPRDRTDRSPQVRRPPARTGRSR